MKWIKDETILVIGHYVKYGVNRNVDDYKKALSVFMTLQKRDESNVISTFKLKLLNIDGFVKNDHKTAGNLIGNKNFIELYESELTMTRYDELMKKDVPLIKGKKTKKSEEVDVSSLDISLEAPLPTHKARVEYSTSTISGYLEMIRTGQYKVPLFQRNFDWSAQDIIDFLNSLLNGHPFGNVTSWVKDGNALPDRNRYIKNYVKSKSSTSETVRWIIDGQQRTTSLISVIKPLSNQRKTKGIIFSLNLMNFKKIDANENNFIYASDLMADDASASSLMKKYNIEMIDATKIMKIRDLIMESPIGHTIISDSDINTTIEIFTEMNTKGKRLSLFDIVHAKWLSDSIDIDLEDLFDTWRESLTSYKPNNLTLLQTLHILIDKDLIEGDKILKYKVKSEEVTPSNLNQILTSIEKASDFLLGIMKFKPEIMPSTNLIKFISYAYKVNGNKEFNANQIISIKKHVKDICLNNYYQSSTNQRLRNNITFIDHILNGSKIGKPIESVELGKEDILELEYGEGSSTYLYAINVLFNYAKSFKSGQSIPIYASNSKSKKINIHHIIPKALVLDGVKISEHKYGNSLANLTPILETENKNINKKTPAKYYKEYKNDNNNLDDELKQVAINPAYLASFNEETTKDMIDTFFNDRAKDVAELVNNF